MTNAIELFLTLLLSFQQRQLITKNADAPVKLYKLRRELKTLTQSARELPVSDDIVLRKIEMNLPGLNIELAELREVLHSKNLRVC